MTDSPLPRVVLTTTASVDGRITISSSSILLQPHAAAQWQTIKPDGTDDLLGNRLEEHGAIATLEGSGSFVVPGEPSPTWPEVDSDRAAELRTDWLARRAPHWFVVADSRGRVDWSWPGDETVALVVLVCETTPAGYLQRLRDMGIGYLMAGDEHVDLHLGLARIRSELGADTVLADSGGTINASLFRGGFVDELDIVALPGLVGGRNTPSVMDGDELGPDDLPIRLELLSHEVLNGGAIRTRYRVLPD